MPNDPRGAPPLAPAAFLTCEPGLAYLVRGGADLFAGVAGRAGSLRLLADIPDGEAVFGMEIAGAALLLLPRPGASLLPVPVEDLGADLARLADAWVSRAVDRARHLPHPAARDLRVLDAPPTLILADGEGELPAGAVAIPPGERPLWCLWRQGRLTGPWGTLEGPGDAPVPVLRTAPLHALDDGLVRACASEDLARKGQLVAALAAFNSRIAARLGDWSAAEGAAFGVHLARLANADAAALTTAIDELTERPASGVPEAALGLESPLLAALRKVAQAAGATLPPDAARGGGEGEDDEEILTVFAANSGLRVRRVRLSGAWWKTDGEGMVGHLRDGTPVALLPQGRSWRLWRPDGAPAVRIDAAVAGTLDEHAFVLYRGFEGTGDHPGRALLRFVLTATRRDMALIGGVGLLAGLLGMASPFLSGMLVQSVIPDGVRSEVAQVVIAMLAVSMGVMGFELVRGLTVLRVESRLGSSIEGALWNRLLRLPPAFFRRYGAGDLAMRADAVNQMRRTLGFATLNALISVIFSVVNLAVLFSYGLKPALLALGVCVVELALLLGMALFNMSLQRQALANAGDMQTLTVQIFQGISKLRVAAAENRLLARWTHLFARDQKLHFRANAVSSGVSAFGAGWNILVMAALIGLVGFGGAKMSLGDYVTYSGVSGQFVAATLSLAGILPALATMIPLWERARPILVEPTEDAGGRLHPGVLRGDIEAVGLTFSHGGGPAVLRDVSVRVPAGSFVAIVGPSGSGKSTLLRLLLGFEQPESGTVLLDDHDLRDLDAGAVRRQLGVVLQHSRIEAGSLYQNIAGAAALSMDEAWEAAWLAGLGPDIAAMPMNLHTYVDDSGATLSGGQRQRLLLARAIARRPRILLLDEATSALDNTTQAHVMETLARLAVTRVVVAHRLSTVRHADHIIVLNEGRVAEQGNYETLAAAGGVFTDLIRRQLT